jgi:PAS domain S-box-containing protein
MAEHAPLLENHPRAAAMPLEPARLDDGYPLAILIWLALGAVLLPLLLLGAYGFNLWVANEQAAELDRVSGYSANLAHNVDRELSGFIETADVLAGSRHLQLGDIATFDQLARDAAAKTDGGHFILTDRSLQQLVNTRANPGEPLPRTVNSDQVQHVFDTGQFLVGDLRSGAIVKQPHFSVRVPVPVNGEVRYVLSYAPHPGAVPDILRQTYRPDGWFASVIDGSGRIVARSHRHNDFFGKPASPDFLAKLTGKEGVVEGVDLEQRNSITSYHTSGISGWKALVWAPKELLAAPTREATWAIMGLVGLALAASILTAWLMARAIGKPVSHLVSAASSIGRGEPATLPPASIREAKLVGQALFDATLSINRREAELRESEARFRNMADYAPVMIWVTGPSGQCTFLSQSWYEFTGQTSETGLGLGWLDATHHDDRAHSQKVFLNANAKREPFQLDYRLRRKDGAYRWVIDSARPRFSANGEFLGYIGSIIDISDRKAAEDAANEARRFAENLMNAAPVSIYLFNCETRQNELINSNAGEMLGYDAEAWKEKATSAFDLMHPEDAERMPAHYERLATDISGRPAEIEYRMRHADGSWRWFLSRDSVYEYAADGRPRKILGTATDITERKRAEEQLRDSEAQARANAAEIEAIYNGVPLGIVLFDKDFHFLRINERLARINGRPAADHIGLPIEDILPPVTVSALRAMQPRLLAGEAITDQELVSLDPRGKETVAWLVSYRPLRNRDGEITQFLGTVLDITGRKQAEDVLVKARTSLELALEAADAAPWDYDVETGRVEWSPQLYSQLGETIDETSPSADKFLAHIHPDDHAAYLALREQERMAEPGSRYTILLRQIGADNRLLRWIERRSYVGPGERGRRRVFGLNIDVTERENAAAALRASEERFKLAINASHALIYDVDIARNGKVATFGLENVTGYYDEEGRLTSAWWHSLIHANDLPSHLATLERHTRSGGRFASEYRIHHADGHWIWVQDDGEIFLGPNGPTRMAGTIADITERKQREEQIRLLMREVNHRSKNMLAVIQVIARQTAASDSKDFVKRFGERVQSLAITQDILVKNDWLGVDLEELVNAQLMQFKGLAGTRIVIKGKPLRLAAASAQNLGLAVHELAANASKYGALSVDEGRVVITWRIKKSKGVEDSFTISWTERDGPPAQLPERRGFGSVVLGSMIRMGLSAETNLTYAKRGFEWQLACPAEKVLQRTY